MPPEDPYKAFLTVVKELDLSCLVANDNEVIVLCQSYRPHAFI